MIKKWILDLKASHYFCVKESLFLSGILEYIEQKIRIMNDDNIMSVNRDKIRLVMNRFINDKSSTTLIFNAIYALALEINLLSSHTLDIKHRLQMNFDISEKFCQILDKNKLIENLISQNNLYLIDLTDMTSIMILTLWAVIVSKKSIFLWHRKFDHLKLNFLWKLQNLAIDMKFDKKFKKTRDNYILSARKTWILSARTLSLRSLIC